MTTCKLSELVSPAFAAVHHEVKSERANEILLPGGRGSTKSSFVSLEIPLFLLKHPQCHAAVFRKVGNTLRSSVYAQCCWAISVLGLSHKFRNTVSPMEITYLPTGQKIFFYGLDDPGKVKSVKVPFGYIGAAWFEELDQFSGPEEIRNVEQSIFRGGPLSLSFKSFNPPAMARNWANRYALQQRQGKLVHHSTYKTTPPEWLGPRFLGDAEHLMTANPTAYAHEYLGEVVGCGTQVFDNIKTDTLTEAQIEQFDRRLHGVDWGYYPDPWAFNSMHLDAGRRVLYIFDESTKWRLGNRQTADLLIGRNLSGEPITADGSEPKSVADYKSYGLWCRGAEKGPGSVMYSHQWLQSLSAIVIDPERCPNTYREFAEYEYERDKQGEVQSGYPDVNNHHIDAVRYATERIWKRKGQ